MSAELNQEHLFGLITEVIQQIEKELAQYKKGIFFAPELHIAFEIGKALFKERRNVFGTEEVKWHREVDLKNGGPSDLVFEANNEKIVFEFKVSDTSQSYEKDINKLERLSESNEFIRHRFFIALVDHFPGQEDARVQLLEKFEPNRLQRATVETNYSRYSGKVDCEVYCCEIN